MLLIYLTTLETEEECQTMTEIYNKYKGLMFKKALKYTSNREQAEDIIHDVFINIIKNKEKIFNLTCMDLQRYIVIMVRNRCIDLLISGTQRIDGNIDDYENTIENNSSDACELIINEENYLSLRKALNEIDEVSKNILEMKYVLGYSYNEIAVKFGMTPKYVDIRLQRAKKRLRKALEGKI